MKPLKAIAAMSRNRVIGCNGQVPWDIPEDFRWVKRATSGQIILMGRKTFDSLGKPLPNRTNVVLTRGPEIPGVVTIRRFEDLNSDEYPGDVIWIFGGAQIYEQFLPQCDELFLSIVKREVEGDAWFPRFEEIFDLAEVVQEHPEFNVLRYMRRRIGGGGDLLSTEAGAFSFATGA